MFRIDNIDHVALTVKDVARSIAWYRDVLGLERRHAEDWGDCPAVLGAGNTAVALFQAATPDPGRAPDPQRNTVMRHLAFRVDGANFATAQVELRGRNIPFHFEDHEITRSIYFHDPDGHQIEITTYDLV